MGKPYRVTRFAEFWELHVTRNCIQQSFVQVQVCVYYRCHLRWVRTLLSNSKRKSEQVVFNSADTVLV